MKLGINYTYLNQNNYNQSFSAQFKYSSKNNLSKETIEKFESVVKDIGNDKDIISIRVGSSILDSMNIYHTPISIVSLIAENLTHVDSSVISGYGRHNTLELSNGILKYLNILNKSTK